MQLAQYIDHTLLKPTATLGDIKRIAEEAIHHSFYAVCIPPYYAAEACEMVRGTGVQVATVIGFPFGYSHTRIKVAELKRAVNDGVHEVDMVMNIAAFKSNDLAYVENEARVISKMTTENNVVVKVIIESGILTEDEIIRCCDLYQNFPIDFLKTSTGYAEKGATVEAVEILRRYLPRHMQIKASGGIKTAAFAEQLIAAGATRLGCSAGVAIVTGQTISANGY